MWTETDLFTSFWLFYFLLQYYFSPFQKNKWRGTKWTWLHCEILLYLRQDHGVLPYSMSQEELALLISASFILCFVSSHCPSEFVQTSNFQMSDFFFFLLLDNQFPFHLNKSIISLASWFPISSQKSGCGISENVIKMS